ncbi:hypothetical protein AWB82_07232 [Caballeronia glebae]|uniref:Uncharacterized protein n=1 Tax=Caballeronia glebae TaxID=1777143 RepID=A0A158DW96_9BURK|nr:hypothetical protein AWB82_07232 [Caballeronia glebae]
MSAFATLSFTFSIVRPSPAKSSVMSLPAPIAILPSVALTCPLLSTCAPSNATAPPGAAVIVASFDTFEPVAPSCLKRYLPARNASFEMPSVDATSDPTFTDAPRANTTPAGFTRNTCPLALSCPAMRLTSLPTTRLSSTACADGCEISTRSFPPIEKPFQFTMPFCEPCVIVIDVALGRLTVTLPA